jgi:hypothetical protein
MPPGASARSAANPAVPAATARRAQTPERAALRASRGSPPGPGAIVPGVLSVRRCSRTGCTEAAVATLTYVYADSTAVVGPLATQAEPHSYDLCNQHAHRLTAPRGWEVVRFEGEFTPPQHRNDDLTALAEAVREAGRADRAVEPAPVTAPGRRAHLRVLPGAGEE